MGALEIKFKKSHTRRDGHRDWSSSSGHRERIRSASRRVYEMWYISFKFISVRPSVRPDDRQCSTVGLHDDLRSAGMHVRH